MDNNGSCSGGNPLKGLTEHVDRNNALHQDRLRNGAAANQAGGFRSQGPSTGHAQQEFNAFMNEGPQLPTEHAALRLDGHATALQEPMVAGHQSYQGPQSFHPLPQAAIPSIPAPTNDWVAEFAAFNARQGVPTPPNVAQPALQQPGPHQPMAHRPYQPFQPRRVYALPDPYGPIPAPQMSMLNRERPAQQVGQSAFTFAPVYDPTNRTIDHETKAIVRDEADDDFNAEMDAWMSSNGSNGISAQDMAGVDAELAAVAAEFGQDDAHSVHVEDPHEVMTDIAEEIAAASRGADEAAARQAETIARINGQLNLESPLEQLSLTDLARQELTSLSAAEEPATMAEDAVAPSTDQVHDPQLAAVAGRLLDAVQHETSDKWAQSDFLRLMRDFRDGKKTIIDNVIHGEDDDEPSFEDPKGKGPARAPDADNDHAHGDAAGMA